MLVDADLLYRDLGAKVDLGPQNSARLPKRMEIREGENYEI